MGAAWASRQLPMGARSPCHYLVAGGDVAPGANAVHARTVAVTHLMFYFIFPGLARIPGAQWLKFAVVVGFARPMMAIITMAPPSHEPTYCMASESHQGIAASKLA